MMQYGPDETCPRPPRIKMTSEPHAPAIYPASVYQCSDPEEARQRLDSPGLGYAYQRDAHPNADSLAEQFCQLHGADRSAITASGMASLSLALLSQLTQGDHLVVSDQLYGRSLQLLTDEAGRIGITSTKVDTCDLDRVAKSMRAETKMVVVETITNPLLRVSPIDSLAELAHQNDALLLVDNSFASPVLCRPLSLGADLVVESVTKIINGHSDVMLGMLCGGESLWSRVPQVASTWGLASSPFDCWLAQRGLATLPLRSRQGCQNAAQVADFLADHAAVANLRYPGRKDHPDFELASKQLQDGFGCVVTFDLAGGLSAAERFIVACRDTIPFCPSLGEVSTTLSHPQSTSHRGLTDNELAAVGITAGTIRLSVGVESIPFLLESLASGLAEV